MYIYIYTYIWEGRYESQERSGGRGGKGVRGEEEEEGARGERWGWYERGGGNAGEVYLWGWGAGGYNLLICDQYCKHVQYFSFRNLLMMLRRELRCFLQMPEIRIVWSSDVNCDQVIWMLWGEVFHNRFFFQINEFKKSGYGLISKFSRRYDSSVGGVLYKRQR